MPSINEALFDTYTSHTVDLARVEAGIQKNILLMLKRLERSLLAELARVDPTGPVRTAFQQRRLTALFASTQETLQEHYTTIRRATQSDLIALAHAEQAFFVSAMNGALGVDLVTPALDPATLRILATDSLIQGAPTAEWWARQNKGLRQAFSDEMRQGLLQQETLSQLTQRIRGTQAGHFTDGIMRGPRHKAEALIRSSVQSVANDVRQQTFKEHDDLIKSQVWSSMLDGRTTILCQVRDRKEYTLDGEPIGHTIPSKGFPPIHWNCRSSMVPRTKSWAELSRNDAIKKGKTRRSSIKKAYERRLREAGFSPSEIQARIFQARSSMDGLVPKRLNFPQWLRRRDADNPGFGAQTLGKARWNLWRSGQLSFPDLVNFRGEPLTVAQLRKKINQS